MTRASFPVAWGNWRGAWTLNGCERTEIITKMGTTLSMWVCTQYWWYRRTINLSHWYRYQVILTCCVVGMHQNTHVSIHHWGILYYHEGLLSQGAVLFSCVDYGISICSPELDETHRWRWPTLLGTRWRNCRVALTQGLTHWFEE